MVMVLWWQNRWKIIRGDGVQKKIITIPSSCKKEPASKFNVKYQMCQSTQCHSNDYNWKCAKPTHLIQEYACFDRCNLSWIFTFLYFSLWGLCVWEIECVYLVFGFGRVVWQGVTNTIFWYKSEYIWIRNVLQMYIWSFSYNFVWYKEIFKYKYQTF